MYNGTADTKSLGLIIDNRLSWSNHVNELCKKVTSAIGALRRIRPLISQSTAVLVYNSLIQPHFDYCSLVWDGLSDQLSDKLQKLQNRAARVILKANYGTSSSLLLDILKWDKLVIRRKKHKALCHVVARRPIRHFSPVKFRGMTVILRMRTAISPGQW